MLDAGRRRLRHGHCQVPPRVRSAAYSYIYTRRRRYAALIPYQAYSDELILRHIAAARRHPLGTRQDYLAVLVLGRSEAFIMRSYRAAAISISTMMDFTHDRNMRGRENTTIEERARKSSA